MLRPKKIDLYITKQFGLLFIGTFLICQFVLMMQFLWKYVDELIGKGLSMDVLAQFFWYMGLMLVPQALPLAILLSSLIAFGNMGESVELTAIKAAGISLMQTFRSLIVISILVSCCSFYFQNNVTPSSNIKLLQLMRSMKMKSPEMEIPEGIFYSELPGSNIYVQKKDMETGKLYGLTIYRRTGSYEDQAIILADSGMIRITADKHHLQLSLWSGEWFENMQSQEFGNSAAVPYRREAFYNKEILIDYDTDFNMSDASMFSDYEKTKNVTKILHDIDSFNLKYDSMAVAEYTFMKDYTYKSHALNKKAGKEAPDTVYQKMSAEEKQRAVGSAKSKISNIQSEISFRATVTEQQNKNIRSHKIEAIKKFTLALSCLIFFFIGAPLGAIIRKGGLGMPLIISVLVFIIYYILDNTGTKMAKLDAINIWVGTLLPVAVLSPLAFWVTYKANHDSTVFNMDIYKEFFMRLFGLRMERHIYKKEVIIETPDYDADAEKLKQITEEITRYAQEHKLLRMPNVVKVFFKYEPDHLIEQISEKLEEVIEDLANTKDKHIIQALNEYPILITAAHTRPFERRWMNIMAAVIFPVGIILYIRMWRFRLRLYRDLVKIKNTNETIIYNINKVNN